MLPPCPKSWTTFRARLGAWPGHRTFDPLDFDLPDRRRFGKPGYGVDALPSFLEVVFDKADPILFADAPLCFDLGFEGFADLFQQTLLFGGRGTHVPQPCPVAFFERPQDLVETTFKVRFKPRYSFGGDHFVPGVVALALP